MKKKIFKLLVSVSTILLMIFNINISLETNAFFYENNVKIGQTAKAYVPLNWLCFKNHTPTILGIGDYAFDCNSCAWDCGWNWSGQSTCRKSYDPVEY